MSCYSEDQIVIKCMGIKQNRHASLDTIWELRSPVIQGTTSPLPSIQQSCRDPSQVK